MLYDVGEAFPVGGPKVLRSAGADQVTLADAGGTVHACLAERSSMAEVAVMRVLAAASVPATPPVTRPALE